MQDEKVKSLGDFTARVREIRESWKVSHHRLRHRSELALRALEKNRFVRKDDHDWGELRSRNQDGTQRQWCHRVRNFP